MIRYILLYIALFISCFTLYSQTIPKKNFTIIDSLIKIESERISYQINENNIKNVKINLSEHTASWLVKQHLLKNLNDRNIKIITANENHSAQINININQIEVQYIIDENDRDSLFRIISVSLDGNFEHNNQIQIIENQTNKYSDKISRNDIEKIKSDYTFANAPVPEKKKSLFEEFAVPFIVVTTAILTVIILFSVRSS